MSLLVVTRVMTGKLNQATDSSINAVNDMFAMCNNIGSVTEAQFLESIDRVYSKCKDDKQCLTQSCEKMTLSDACMTIDKSKLKAAGLSQFYFSASDEWGARIMCGEKDHSPESEIDVFNPPTNRNKETDRCSSWTVVSQAPFFKAKAGSVIEVKAETRGLILKSTDVDVKIKNDGDC